MNQKIFNKINVKKITVLIFITTVGVGCASVHSNEDERHKGGMHIDGMHEEGSTANFTSSNNEMLTYPGNMIFGTVQEAVNRLLASPDTDWKKVDVEGLRQHLLDMKNFSENVLVLSKQNISNGLEVTIKVEPNALSSLERVLSAHPAQLYQESGWTMEVVQLEDEFTLTITTEVLDEVEKLRGLGYFGLMVYGNHHVSHHWMMIQGIDAHS